jgi:hypothetical protein
MIYFDPCMKLEEFSLLIADSIDSPSSFSHSLSTTLVFNVVAFVFVLVRSSSTEHPSGGDPEIVNLHIERPRGTGESLSSPNIQPETASTNTGKHRRDKTNNKGQQDEEEEPGQSHHKNTNEHEFPSLFHVQKTLKSMMVMPTFVNALLVPYVFQNMRVMPRFWYVIIR